ncbi:MAG: HD domain-containing protein [Candidatus Campbellbacteria bacterium]|nr:HD domain-containing protein [Candidatus Campbellbacteria bacterium]
MEQNISTTKNDGIEELKKDIHYLKDEEIDFIHKAYEFSKKFHKGQKRKSGEEYITHPIAASRILASLNMDCITIAACLLHDTLEDTEATEEDIKENFGKDILFLVKGVSNLGGVKYRGLKRHISSLQKLFVATSMDIRVIIIKLCDRLHNMRTLQHLPEEKRKRIAEETKYVYIPVADRLGIQVIKSELEDLAFLHLKPNEHKNIQDIIRKRTSTLNTISSLESSDGIYSSEVLNIEEKGVKYLQDILKTLKKQLVKKGVEATDFRTEWRIKSNYSLYKKLQKKGGDIHNIKDILALRVIVKTIEDCYKVLGIVHSIWTPIPNSIKDYIATPKPNGYKSLHTVILTHGKLFEFQIRTEEMDLISKFGIASHFSYKEKALGTIGQNISFDFIRTLLSKKKVPIKVNSNISTPIWLKKMSSIFDEEDEKVEKKEDPFLDFLNERIFIYTPKNEVIDMPHYSTPLDFAYALHTDIGNHAIGAIVNGKMSSLKTQLGNGDIVRIITKKTPTVNEKWLYMVKTNAAKRIIRASLRKLNLSKLN